MTAVKIISNPYKKNIAYERQNAFSKEWIPITEESNPNSSLVSYDLSHGFFPFYVDKIVDAIVSEYQDQDGKVTIEFQGTEDEYNELALVCGDDDHKDSVKLTKSDSYLENARDVLPDIIDIFKRLNPLISETVQDRTKIQKELDKFTDVANDTIPICILGNYSCGKSTFINALVGAEIMPSGDEPVTAKIYRVSRSKQSDRGNIAFTYDDEDIKIRLDNTSYRFIGGESDKELITLIKKDLDSKPDASMSERVHTILSDINSFENNHIDAEISDLIDVKYPFAGGLWRQAENDFVIFDTPGSNSASNDKHMQVLKKAIEDLSNGLPIFVSEYNTLDSTDNEKLKQEIEGMPELDSRFTMIVVNKADAASLPRDGFSKSDVSRLLGESIPSSLYKEGIFFVSSIMGLGSKTKGKFIDEHTSEIYDDQEKKYCDPENKRYKQLYIYDIMPAKQRNHAVEAAQKEEDIIFANSGLFSIEREIQVFATKYSSYNKCQQSQLFLDKVIKITSDEIELAKKDREETKKQSEDKLEKDKKDLIDLIQQEGDTLLDQSIKEYPDTMQNLLKQIHEMYYQESLKDEQQELIDQQRKELNSEEYQLNAKKSSNSVGGNLIGNLKSFAKTPSVSAFKAMGREFHDDRKAASECKKALASLNKEIDRNVGDQIVQMINDDFKKYCSQAQDMLNEKSAVYWNRTAIDIKKKLAEIVMGSSALSEDKRGELSDVIISYQGIDFDNQEKEVFVKSDYEYGLKLFNIKIWKSDKINLERLRRSYNEEMEQDVHKIYCSIEESHDSSVKRWLQSLYNTITGNIVSFNPQLHAQQELINRETERIIDLENKQRKVYRYSEEIKKKIDWKES